VFQAALEQAEQLMRAAAEVGAAARPLPLFYSLSQAGRAITAARVGDPWRLGGHGLHVPRENESKALLRRVIRLEEQHPPDGRRHSFAGVAEATESRQLTAAVELGAVWAAIADLMDPLPQPVLEDSAWRRPLRVWRRYWTRPDPFSDPRSRVELLVDGLPATEEANVLLAALAEYPTASAGEPSTTTAEWAPNNKLLPTFVWYTHGDPAWNHDQKLEEIAPYWSGNDRVLIPRLGGRDFLSPLMLWWLLLFGLSIVARYEPELWIRELDVNRSRLAVPIEAALDVALEVLPERILAALT
jgi:hypothetical protein